MALELSVKAELLKNETNVEQQIILEIDGIPFIYGAVEVTKIALYGDDIEYGDAGLLYGGITADPAGRAYISLANTTRQITQQLEIDKGGIGSVQKFTVELVDKNQEVTKAFQPGENVDDILSREANVFLGFQGSAHPEDSVRIFNGIVTSQVARPGSWRLNIDHPEYLKRRAIFQQINTRLTSGIDDSVTTLTADTTTSIISPADAVESYVRIGDELIQFSGISGSDLTGLTRGALGTTAAAHSAGDEIVTFYRLQGDPIDLALKIMLSNTDNSAQVDNIAVPRFEQISASLNITNGIFIEDTRFRDDKGLELGDLVSITGDPNPANNVTDAPIAAFVDQPTGVVLVLSGVTLVTSIDSPAILTAKSQFNTLPNGCGCQMKMSQVDVSQFLRLKTLFPSLPASDFYLKETVDARDFLKEQVYKPYGLYEVPRKGRCSATATLPPLVLDELVELTDDNVKKAGGNQLKRSLKKDFFTNVVYVFEENELDERFLAGEVEFSQRALNRFDDIAERQLLIEAKGMRDNPATRNFIAGQTRRFTDRYQFAAESIEVQTNYKQFNVEVADIVLFGNANLQLPDFQEGDRSFRPRLMEVVNKKLDVRGNVSFNLLDTGFGLDGRFATVAPNSNLAADSTTSIIFLKNSFDTGEFELERDKWVNFVGEEVRIRSQDFTFSEVRTITQFDPGSLTGLVLNTPLSVAPPEDYLLDLPDYPDTTDPSDNAKMKAIHPFFSPQVTITAGISTTIFEVAPADIDKFFVDAFVIVHNDDYTDRSTDGTVDDDLQVTDVDTGTNRVTVSGDMGFTPAAGYLVGLIGFKDQGLPYRLI